MKIEKLLEKVKAGDTDALKIIYERYSPMMRSICFSITKEDEDTINDLVQEAFVLTYYSLSKLGSVRKLGCKQQAYAHSFVNLKRKKGISATPLNWLLNAFTLALNDSAPALVCLFTK